VPCTAGSVDTSETGVGDTGCVLEQPRLTPGERELLIDGLSDDVAFDWVLIHLGIRANPSASAGPPSVADVDSAFSVLDEMMRRGLVNVGHMEYVDGVRRWWTSWAACSRETRRDPIPEVKRSVLHACESGSDCEWSCWVVNKPLACN
jgi:hypothetical protein